MKIVSLKVIHGSTAVEVEHNFEKFTFCFQTEDLDTVIKSIYKRLAEMKSQPAKSEYQAPMEFTEHWVSKKKEEV